MKPLLALLAAIAALAALLWASARDLRLPWRLYGYESSHSQVTGHHPWWFHVLSHRFCAMCAMGFGRRASSDQQVDPDDDMAGVQVDVRPMRLGGVMGPVRPFIVGESGPEWFIPSRDARILSTQTGPLGPTA